MSNRFRIYAATLALAAATLAAAPSSAQTLRPAAAVLTQEQARARSDRVSEVSYELTFRLDGELPEYTGNAIIRFELADTRADLTLDFAGGTIYSLLANGMEVDGRYNDFYLTLPHASLRAGRNRVAIGFSRPYSSDGSGLYRFRDPEDGRVYLYTDFEPYDQNRLFPSFDQPDLKARYTTAVTAPATWHVIANTSETSVTDADDDERTWTFPATAPISTYVYALHAGEYHVWESQAGNIPLRLFARESIAPYVHPEQWFMPTRQGFAFYQRYFDVPYPFGKYDQIIVPHYNAGAMENVGAVTFNERYLRRGTVTRQDRRALTNTILHEMAHMWFGDLVTMDWWSGIWLNESFATVMAVLAMVDATEFTDEWLDSYRDTIRAYQADERDTTHSIDQPIPDTDSAFASFDRITYEKGSATLIQLNYLVGPDVFRRGVGDYLKAHAFGNTSLADFLGAVSEAAGQSLELWADDWLLQPGTNAVEVKFDCERGRIRSLEITQSAPAAWPTLRTHRTQLGLYDFESGQVRVRTFPVTYSGERTEVPATRGEACPDMIYANHGDWDYARARLDPDSLPLLGEHLSAFDDPLARLMLWQSVWDMVLDARLAVFEYVDFALSNLGDEANEAVVRQVLAALQSSLRYMREIDADGAGLAGARARIESYLWSRAQAAEPSSDRQLLYFDNYVAAAASGAALDRLAGFLDSRDLPNGLELDQDRHWSLLGVLGEYGHESFLRLFAAERERDRSDEGQRRALAVEVGQPNRELKARWIAALLDESQTPTLAEFRAVAAGLFPSSQFELQLQASDTVLASLKTVSDSRDQAFFPSFVGGLLGPLCSSAYLERLDNTIAKSESLHPIIVRLLKDSRFETARCLRIAAHDSN